jgi:hypothetical protein
MTDYHHSNRSDYAGSTFSGPIQYNREETNRARKAAEAIFAPKQRINEQSAPAAAPTADLKVRKPRILSAVQVQPTRVEPTEAAVASVPPKPVAKIPASHLGRIRTWLKYGMTMPQVAKVYGVTIDDIERVLQKA